MAGKPRLVGFGVDERLEVEALLARLAEDHADSVLLLALADESGPSGATEADFVELGTHHVTMAIAHESGTSFRRLEFGHDVRRAGEVQAALLALLGAARAARPDHPATSVEVMLADTAALGTHLAEVVAVERLTAGLVQLTVRADHDVPALGGDEFWYLLVPRPGAEDVIGPGFEMSDRDEGPESRRPFGAYYTTRRRRDAEREIDFWVVLHGHPEGVAGWAADVEVGARLAMWGPRRTHAVSDDAAAHLLVCDETGLAACAALVEALPAGHPVTLMAEVATLDDLPPIPERRGLELRCVARGEAPAGTSGVLLEAVRQMAPVDSRTHVYGAAESREISAVRRHVRETWGLPQSRVTMTGYWRRDLGDLAEA